MTSELKPCPFCGGEAHYTKEISSANLAAVVMCSDNDCCSNRAETLEKAISLWNTRAVPDVPELVRYGKDLLAAGWFDKSAQSPDGEYVLHSQAAEIIAAKDAAQKTWQQIAKHHTGYENPSMAFRVLLERAEAAEAKLAQWEDQEPVMWLCVLNDAGADRAIATSFPSRRDILQADGYGITALYASPAPAPPVVTE